MALITLQNAAQRNALEMLAVTPQMDTLLYDQGVPFEDTDYLRDTRLIQWNSKELAFELSDLGRAMLASRDNSIATTSQGKLIAPIVKACNVQVDHTYKQGADGAAFTVVQIDDAYLHKTKIGVARRALVTDGMFWWVQLIWANLGYIEVTE